jgi:hypothetical protein
MRKPKSPKSKPAGKGKLKFKRDADKTVNLSDKLRRDPLPGTSGQVDPKLKGKKKTKLFTQAEKAELKKDKAAFEKQMATIKALGSIMKGEQKARLQKIIQLLES